MRQCGRAGGYTQQCLQYTLLRPVIGGHTGRTRRFGGGGVPTECIGYVGHTRDAARWRGLHRGHPPCVSAIEGTANDRYSDAVWVGPPEEHVVLVR